MSYPQHMTQTSKPAVLPAADILIIEDNPELRRALELSLGHLGNLCFSAGTVEQAVSLLSTFVMDIVICDYHLPDGDGFTFMERLPDSCRGLPCILISGDNDVLLTRRARALGYHACFSKPLNLQQLADTIVRLTRHPHSDSAH